MSTLSDSLRPYLTHRMLVLLLLGFASGLPSPLIMSNLSLWLQSAGVSRTGIGLFALASTPFAINFLWAPLVDRMPIPVLSRALGQRRAWILLCQLLLVAALAIMSLNDPGQSLQPLALACVAVAFLSATQDIAIDAYRINALKPAELGRGSAVTIWGWHLGGTLIGGAGGLYLAHHLGWNNAYLLLTAALGIGILATLMAPEPPAPALPAASAASQGRHALLSWLDQAVMAPFQDFTRRDGWLLVLVFIFMFKFGDAMLGRMSGVFYRELGFELTDIAQVSKLYGLLANMIGVFMGGVVAHRLGYLRALFVSGLLAAATNLLYALLAQVGPSYAMLCLAVVSDNFTTGLVTVAFVAYLSSLCNLAYSATQYSLLSSLGNLSRIWLSASAGLLVDRLEGNWSLFFLLTTGLALLGLPLLILIMRHFPLAGRMPGADARAPD